ncbi:MAG: site-specific integrase [Planctomycetes bacterium]|nr:site-specific integrase [Planctomycetota bacterium]
MIAEQVRHEERARLGVAGPDPIMTIGQVAEEVKRDYLPVELRSPRYVRLESRRLDFVVEWFGKEKPLTSITTKRVAEFRAALLQRGPGGAPLSTGGANPILARLANMLHLACEWGYLDACPVLHKFTPKMKAVRLTRAHADQLLVFAAARPSLLDAITFAAGTGCRLGELEFLRWGEVDLSSGTITFRDTKNGEDRVIGILPDVRKLLERLRAKIPLPIPADAPVLRSAEGCAWRLQGGIERRHFQDLVKKSAIPQETTWHDFRHMFSTWARSQGWPRDVIKKWMGHKTDQAAARYSHVSTEELLEAAAGRWARPTPSAMSQATG